MRSTLTSVYRVDEQSSTDSGSTHLGHSIGEIVPHNRAPMRSLTRFSTSYKQELTSNSSSSSRTSVTGTFSLSFPSAMPITSAPSKKVPSKKKYHSPVSPDQPRTFPPTLCFLCHNLPQDYFFELQLCSQETTFGQIRVCHTLGRCCCLRRTTQVNKGFCIDADVL